LPKSLKHFLSPVKLHELQQMALYFVILESGINFINILQAAFASTDPESIKKTDNLTVFFALSGSKQVKAAPRMLMKLTPVVDFTNMFAITFKMCGYEKRKKTV